MRAQVLRTTGVGARAVVVVEQLARVVGGEEQLQVVRALVHGNGGLREGQRGEGVLVGLVRCLVELSLCARALHNTVPRCLASAYLDLARTTRILDVTDLGTLLCAESGLCLVPMDFM